MGKGNSRIFYFDVLNVLACIAVVALHCNGCFWQFSYERYWRTSVVIESLCYFAVPVFVMLSGATLLDYNERYSLKEYFQKRISRTVIPYIFWSLIGIEIFHGLHTFSNVRKVFNFMIDGKAVGVYWFFPMIFGVYLAVPVLAAVAKNLREKVYGYAIVIAFITISLAPTLMHLFHVHYNAALGLPVLQSYLIYVLLGYWLAQYKISAHLRKTIYFLGVIGLLIHWFGTYYLSLESGKINQLFKGYINFPTVLYSTAVFIWIKYSDTISSIPIVWRNCFKLASEASLGVYLIHFYFVTYFPRWFHFSSKALEWRTFGGLCVWFLSLLIVLFLKRLPIIQRFVP